MKTLKQLLPEANQDIEIRDITLDSRHVRPGSLFLAVPGAQQDGRRYIGDALSQGAAAVVSETSDDPLPSSAGVPMIAVTGLSQKLSAIAGRFHDDPSHGMTLIGVTGTNGKTSVTQLLAQALDRLGTPCGIIGTLGTGFHNKLRAGRHTTPDALSVQAQLAELKRKGAKAVVMEVSSHGLEQGRVAALDFDIAVFTNLSRDHLDYHGSMEAYAAVKAQFFTRPELHCRVINRDDPFGAEWAAIPQPSPMIDYSLTDPCAALFCTSVMMKDDGVQADIRSPDGTGVLQSPLLGRFNLSNLLAVVGALLGMGHSLTDVLSVVPELEAPPGRMQRLGGHGEPLVVIDYAHTPDALEKVLVALRPHAKGRLICLFGCGGERDKGKRPLMAQIAEVQADQVWVTDDNPRNESSSEIIAEIRRGFEHPDRVRFVPPRERAINQAIASAADGDIVLLAGKGHENYQEVNGVRHPLSDLELARQALSAWEVTHA